MLSKGTLTVASHDLSIKPISYLFCSVIFINIVFGTSAEHAISLARPPPVLIALVLLRFLIFSFQSVSFVFGITRKPRFQFRFRLP